MLSKSVFVAEGSLTFVAFIKPRGDIDSAVYGKIRILSKAFPTVTAFTGTSYTLHTSLMYSKAGVLAELELIRPFFLVDSLMLKK